METAVGKSHLKVALTGMMLERAIKEVEHGNLQNAVRLARSVILTYPTDETEIESHQHQIEQQLLGSIDELEKVQIVDLIKLLSEFRVDLDVDDVNSFHSKSVSVSLDSKIAAAIIGVVVPEFEYSADEMYSRFKDAKSITQSSVSQGITFGEGAISPELLSLLLSCMPVIQFFASIALGGFLPAILSGRSSQRTQKEFKELLLKNIEENAELRLAINELRKANDIARDGATEEIETLVALALLKITDGDGKATTIKD